MVSQMRHDVCRLVTFCVIFVTVSAEYGQEDAVVKLLHLGAEVSLTDPYVLCVVVTDDPTGMSE